MKAIFCHDLPIYKDIDGVYCSTTLNDRMFERYFSVAEQLVVATRVYPMDTSWRDTHNEAITLRNLTFMDAPNLMSIKGMLFDRRAFKKSLKREIETTDLVFIRGGETGNIAGDICRELKKPYLVECGGCSWESFWYHSLAGKLIAPRMEWKQRQLVKHAAFVVYVTDRFLQQRYPTEGKHTGISNVVLAPLDDAVLAKRLNKIQREWKNVPHVIGTTAAVDVRYKGHEFVIRALAQLKKEGYALRYEMVGGGTPAFLKNLAQELGVENEVAFLGEKTHEEVLAWLDTVDIYAQPSRQEGLPRALIEAMSRACPAIGSKTAGIPELLQPQVIFNNCDVAAIAGIIRAIIGEEEPYAPQKLAADNFHAAKGFEGSLLAEKRKTIFLQYQNMVEGLRK